LIFAFLNVDTLVIFYKKNLQIHRSQKKSCRSLNHVTTVVKTIKNINIKILSLSETFLSCLIPFILSYSIQSRNYVL